MAALAIVARPRLWLAGALLGITLFGHPEPCRERTPAARSPAPVVVQLVAKSDLATIEPDPGDHMNIGVGPLASWITHLLQKLAGDAC